jgi:hypothetical protein
MESLESDSRLVSLLWTLLHVCHDNRESRNSGIQNKEGYVVTFLTDSHQDSHFDTMQPQLLLHADATRHLL